jgi:hypothetical protein
MPGRHREDWKYDIDPLILNLSTRWRSVVNFMRPRLYLPEKHRYPFKGRLGGRMGPGAGLEVLETR